MHIVLIKPDGIGDYFLYRNFLPAIKKHFGSGCKLTGILKPNIRGFADVVDRDLWDRLYWLEPQRLIDAWLYRTKWEWIAKRLYADIVVYPMTSRISPVDWLISKIPAAEKIGSVNDLKCMSEKRSRETDGFYTRLVPFHPERPRFEFFSYQDFFQGWLQETPPAEPFWEPSGVLHDTPPVVAGKSYALIFPGAGQPYRKWPAERLGLVARHLIQGYRLDVLIAGSAGDEKEAKEIIRVTGSSHVKSVCGKLELHEVAALVAKSTMVIANDSAPMHLAALLRVPLIAISSTRDYGRYHPYPLAYGLPARFVYPAASRVRAWQDETRENIAAVHNEDGKFSVTDVTVEQVIYELESLLASRKG